MSDEQAEISAQEELERLKQQLARQKRKNQRLVEQVQGNHRFYKPAKCPN
jgi:hypothetical protein